MQNGKRTSAMVLPEPPCCIQKHPTEPVTLIGAYKLESDGRKHGLLSIYRHENSLNLIKSIPTAAVLDLKFNEQGNIVASCHHDGTVKIWKYEDENLILANSIVVFEETATSVNFRPHQQNLVAATCTDGNIAIVDIDNGQCTYLDTQHQLECWINAFGELGELSSILFTGGDDSALITHDLRTGSQVWCNRRSHQAGVVSILPTSPSWNSSNPHHLWTGSYDDNLRIFDLRVIDKKNPALVEGYVPRVEQEKNLGGGVWRLIPSREPGDNRVLACCMYDGARIVDVQGEQFHIKTYFKEDHESMCYGGDWLSANELITCSFYDKVVQTWSDVYN